jgi:hypothetical protein
VLLSHYLLGFGANIGHPLPKPIYFWQIYFACIFWLNPNLFLFCFVLLIQNSRLIVKLRLKMFPLPDTKNQVSLPTWGYRWRSSDTFILSSMSMALFTGSFIELQ